MTTTFQPPRVTVEERTYVRNVHAPHAVRRFVRWQLAAWNLARLIEPAEVIASELVTNAVQNAWGDMIAVRLECVGGSVSVKVWDDNPESPTMSAPEPGDEHGRGLLITDALAEHWGTYRVATGGKVVYALITGKRRECPVRRRPRRAGARLPADRETDRRLSQILGDDLTKRLTRLRGEISDAVGHLPPPQRAAKGVVRYTAASTTRTRQPAERKEMP